MSLFQKPKLMDMAALPPILRRRSRKQNEIGIERDSCHHSICFDVESAGSYCCVYDESTKNRRDDISPLVQKHLMKVYAMLCCASVVSVLGACLPLLWNPGALITSLAAVATIVGLFQIPLKEEKVRIALLMTAAIFLGASIRLLFDLVTPVETSFVIRGLVGVAIAFACFSGAATQTKCSLYLYIGGCFTSGILILVWLFVAASIFGQLAAFVNFMLYTWGLILLGYIVLETQKVVQKADAGDLDYVVHAVAFFFDYIYVFVRLLIIRIEKDMKKSKEEQYSGSMV